MTALELKPFSGAAPDTKAFRIGACRVYVDVTPLSGTASQYRAVGCGMVYSDQGLAGAVVTIPLGQEIGALAQDGAALFDTTKLKKFSAARLFVQISEIDIQDQKLDVANDPGIFLALDGFISAVEFSFAGTSQATAAVTIQSNLAKMSAANNVFGRFSALNGLQAYHSIAAFQASMDPTSELATLRTQWETGKAADFWGYTVKALETVLGANQQVVQATIEGETSKAVQRLAQALGPPGAAAAAEMTSRFVSHALLAQDTFDAGTLVRTKNRLAVTVEQYVKASAAGGTLLEQLNMLCGAHSLRLVGLASKAHVIPYWPTWSSKHILTLPAGASFQVSHPSSTLDGTTVVVGAITSASILGPSGQLSTQGRRFNAYIGSYLIPQELAAQYKEFAVFRSVELPDFIEEAGLQYVPSQGEKKIAEQAKLQAQTSTKSAAAGATEARPNLSEATIACLYARQETYEALFGPRQLTVETAIRRDIIPGMNIRVDMPQQGAGSTLSLVGYVSSVRIEIDAASSSAKTVCSLTHVRYLDEQTGIVDAQDNGVENAPFLWQNKADEIAALYLWDKQ